MGPEIVFCGFIGFMILIVVICKCAERIYYKHFVLECENKMFVEDVLEAVRY